MAAPAEALSQNEQSHTLFLGVTNSAKGMQWHDRLQPGLDGIATAISQRYELPDVLGRVMAARGVELDHVETVLDPTLKALMPDPSTLQDMQKGAERLAKAILDKEKVAVFGDYDVDGACSSALVKKFFEAHGSDALIYIPDRIFEGYGPNAAALEGLIKDGASLIITVDCGATSHEALGAIEGKGADVVVIDHHQMGELLPPAHAVINPNRQDDLSGQGHLAAAGVVFLTLVATSRLLREKKFYGGDVKTPDLLAWLDIVALATVCDVVPLQTLNRAYVRKGLEVMRMRQNAGLRALQDVAGLNAPPTPYTLGFALGPRINAGGRIGEASLGAKLLTLDDEIEAGRIAELLDKLNSERKAMEKVYLEEAIARTDQELEKDPDKALIITGSKDYHKGLVGLVAARLTEKFRRPSIVISWEDDTTGTASARSITGADIGAAIRAAVDEGLLVKGGGHAMAAGLTVTRDKLDDLEKFLDQKLREDVGQARTKEGLKVDGALMPGRVTLDFMDLLEKAGPFGQGNPGPKFVFPAIRVSFAKVVGENHIRVTLAASDNSKINGIAFRAVGTPLGDLLLAEGGKPIHVLGTLKRDSWGGREKVDLMIDDAADPQAQS